MPGRTHRFAPTASVGWVEVGQYNFYNKINNLQKIITKSITCVFLEPLYFRTLYLDVQVFLAHHLLKGAGKKDLPTRHKVPQSPKAEALDSITPSIKYGLHQSNILRNYLINKRLYEKHGETFVSNY
jgi:hypothetical protein